MTILSPPPLEGAISSHGVPCYSGFHPCLSIKLIVESHMHGSSIHLTPVLPNAKRSQLNKAISGTEVSTSSPITHHPPPTTYHQPPITPHQPPTTHPPSPSPSLPLPPSPRPHLHPQNPHTSTKPPKLQNPSLLTPQLPYPLYPISQSLE